jgi:hypothetical protein
MSETNLDIIALKGIVMINIERQNIRKIFDVQLSMNTEKIFLDFLRNPQNRRILFNIINTPQFIELLNKIIIEINKTVPEVEINGVYIPDHLTVSPSMNKIEFNPSMLISTNNTNFKITNNIFFKPDIIDPKVNMNKNLILNEIKNVNSLEINSIEEKVPNFKCIFRLDTQTLSLSSLLKSLNDEKIFRNLFNFIRSKSIPVVIGGNNKYYKKYLKYKNKYLYLKNKKN